MSYTAHPTCYTPHITPYVTPHITPYMLHPTCYTHTLHPHSTINRFHALHNAPEHNVRSSWQHSNECNLIHNLMNTHNWLVLKGNSLLSLPPSSSLPLPPGVLSIAVALLAEKAELSYNPKETNPDRLAEEVKDLGFGVEVLDEIAGIKDCVLC